MEIPYHLDHFKNLNCRTTSNNHTHALIKLFIAAMAYYINTLNSQSSGRGMCGPNYFKVGDHF